MEDFMRWVGAGQLKPPKVTLYALDKVADAHAAIESGLTVGKLVLTTPSHST